MQNNHFSKQSQQIIVGKYYPELDGIRSIAIILVLFFHCRIIATPQSFSEKIYYKLAEVGWVGVDLFFVLSGFLITGILLDTIDHKQYFRNFYLRRILRIFPLYYAVLVVFTVLALFGFLPPFEQRSLIAQISYWVYMQNWLSLFGLSSTNIISHFWSLAIEEQFYLIWPALLLFAAKRKRLLLLCVSTVVLAMLSRAVFVSYKQSAYFFTLPRMDTLALGALVAVLLRQYKSMIRFRHVAFFMFVVAVGFISVIAVIQKGIYGHDPKMLLYGMFPLAILFSSFLVIVLTAKEHGILRSILRAKWLRTIGVISYGVYIYHWPIVVLLKEEWPNFDNFWVNELGFLVIVGIFSVTIAWLSYKYFEQPFLYLKDKVAPVRKQ